MPRYPVAELGRLGTSVCGLRALARSEHASTIPTGRAPRRMKRGTAPRSRERRRPMRRAGVKEALTPAPDVIPALSRRIAVLSGLNTSAQANVTADPVGPGSAVDATLSSPLRGCGPATPPVRSARGDRLRDDERERRQSRVVARPRVDDGVHVHRVNTSGVNVVV